MGYIGMVVLAMIVAALGEAMRARALRMAWQDTAHIAAWQTAGTAFLAVGGTLLIIALFLFFRDYVSIWLF